MPRFWERRMAMRFSTSAREAKFFTRRLVGASICVLLHIGGTAAGPCDPAGNVRFVCDQSSPEDLAIVPGGQWVIASGMGEKNAGIRAINVRDSTPTLLFPAPSAKVRQDNKTYKACPGPLDAAGQAAFKAHGLYLQIGKSSLHRLFVVHHGSRESIEVFDPDVSAAPTLTWVGCAVAPEGPGLNSVVGLADGGFLATNFHPRVGERPPWLQKARAGENTGEVWEWRPSSGWSIVPGSEAPGPNGLEISKDGKWLYIGVWGGQSVTRLSRGQTPAKKDSVVVGFRVTIFGGRRMVRILAAGRGTRRRMWRR